MLRRALFVTLIGSLVPVLIGVTQVIGVLRGQLPTLPFHSYFAPREADDPRLGVAVAFTTGDWGSAVRPAGTLGGPVAFGEYAGLVMVLLAGLLITGAATRSGWRSATRVTYAVLLTAIVVGTFSRSAWIITLFGLGVVFLAARSAGAVRVSRTGAWLAASLLVVVVASSIAIVVAMFPGAVSSNLFSLFESGGRLGEHLDLRRAAVQLWLDNPLLGVGIGNYGALTGQGGLVSSAHATFVTELAEGGLVGVALLGGFCAATIRSAWRGLVNARAHRDIYPWALGLFAATVALVLNNIALYDTLFRDTSWVFLGLASVAGAVTAPPSR